ncbi:MAG: SGNH/GDSL hydrolase family protein [Dysgonamonadaceae bacterium]|jgi:hypothetical protein|nr:SGNH/GDSL hydrolase family protein [Dysgonamonadaceae bacterium]
MRIFLCTVYVLFGAVSLCCAQHQTEITKEQLDPINRTLPSVPYVEFGNNRRGEAFHILVVGNSLSFHSKAENIGWLYENGMAASASDRDYVHQLLKMTDSIMPDRQITVGIIFGVGFERNFATFDPAQYEHLLAWRPDVVLFQLGENVSFDEMNTPALFEQKYKELVRYFKKNGNPATICATTFWMEPVRHEVITQVALSTRSFLAELSHLVPLDKENLAKEEENYRGDKSTWSVDGISMHPGDKGMCHIAREIFVIINAVFASKK